MQPLMIESDDLKLAELLCARLCHDLASPLGAASAGLELLEDGADPETAGLVAASMAAATARLKFLRTALGPATDMPHSPAALAELVRAYLAGAAPGGISLGWSCHPAEIGGETARLLLNMTLICRDALPRGGRIEVEIAARGTGAGAGLTVTARGDGAGLSAEARLVLVEGAPLAGPRGAQASFTRRTARLAGAGITVETDSERIRVMA